MTEQSDRSDDAGAVPLDRWVDSATRIVRLLAWIAMLAVCCPMLWVLSGMAAHAEDPKAAARAIGQAGTAAAGAIARDASKAGTVPGYAGTNVPERNLGAGTMEDAARARLADPDDPGGKAGRAVIEGVTARPAANVPASDPAVVRGKGIAASPQSAAHGADNLASGGASDCGAGLGDAQGGASCGSVRWCVGADCDSVAPRSNTGFVDATSRLNMALELGGEEFDRDRLRFFKGRRRACHIHFGGLANCCKNSGLLVGLANCSAGEVSLAEERNAGNTHYLGKYCSRRTFFGICIRRSRAWCVFGSKLGRILQELHRPVHLFRRLRGRRQALRAGHDAEVGGLQLQRDAASGDARLLHAPRHRLGELPQDRSQLVGIGNVFIQRGLRRHAPGLAVRIDGSVVLATGAETEAPADLAVARDKRGLVEPGELADEGDPVPGETLLHRLAHAPEQADGLVGKKILRLGPSDHRESARLVEVGSDLGQELVVAEPDRDGDAKLILDPAGEGRQGSGRA